MVVLVGYVPTPEGEAALAHGLAEATRRRAPCFVVNTSRGDALVDRRFVLGEALDALRARLAGSGVAAELRQPVRGREPADELLAAAEEVGASLLVVGLRRRSPVGKLVLGSTAQRVLLDAACDVLAVKAGSSPG